MANLIGELFGVPSLGGSIGSGTITINQYNVSVSDITGGHRITVTKGTNVQTLDVLNGEKGDKGDQGETGDDGFSPTVTVEEITGGHMVTITDAGGDHVFDVMDGQDVGTSDHTELTNRDAENQHPISAITGLEAALAAKGTYSKPSGGIPKTDLASAVQTSLGRADSALQSESDPLFSASPASGITSQNIQSWNAKQDAISDLATIRSGAAAGATAYQKPSTGIPKSDLASAVQDSLGLADTALQAHQSLAAYRTSASQDVIDTGKQDKLIAGSGISIASDGKTISVTGGGGGTSDHTQLTNRDAENQHPISAINGLQSALDGKGTYSKPSGGIPKTDLASAVQTSLGRADSALQSESDPVFSASPASGITSQNIQSWNAKQDAISDLATIRSGAAAGATAYQKPSTGIPKTDLASAVQTSLGLADSALQEHQSLSAYRTSSAQDVIDAKKEPNHGHPYALDGANLKDIFGNANALYAALEREDYSQIHNLDYYPIKFQGTYRDYGEWVALTGTDYYSDTACKNRVGAVSSNTVVSYEDASPAYYSATVGGAKRYFKMQDCQRWREKTINMTAKMEANINVYWRYGDSGDLKTGVPHIMWLARDGIASLKFRSSNQQWADAVEQAATGDGSTTVYTPGDATLKCVRYVCVDGVLQTYNTAYTVNTSTGAVTFKSGYIPASGAAILISRTTHDLPWVGSAIYQTFNDPDHGLLRLIDDAQFASHIHTGPNGKGMRFGDETRTVANSVNAGWTDRGKMFLPTEPEVWGLGIYGAKDLWLHLPQLPVFACGGRRRICKGNTDGGSPQYWFTASSTNVTSIAIVHDRGVANAPAARGPAAAVPGIVGV